MTHLVKTALRRSWISWILAAALWVRAGADDTCVDCHSQLEGSLQAPVLQIETDAHYQRGISCAGCHGGDPTELDPDLSMSPSKGFVGTPGAPQIPAFCARCHSDVEYMKHYNPKLPTDQLAQYKTSVHGKRLAKGDTQVATCISCHGVHGILRASDTRSPVFKTNIPKTCATCHANKKHMASYGIPTNQYHDYLESVHGKLLLEKKELSAAACTDCHGNHGASPPGLSDVAGACGECHPSNRDLFEKSPHKEPFQKVGQPQCAACHGNHKVLPPSDEFLGTGEGAVCIRCHKPGSKGYEISASFKALLDSLKMATEEARRLVKKAEVAGVKVGLAKFDLRACEDAVVRSRSDLHSFILADFRVQVQEGRVKAQRVKEAALVSLKDIEIRRKGLVFSAVVILFLCIGLWLKIRKLEKEQLNQT
jgi:predicted CXXCH cytochrome family protein